jgi:uncharacterized Fe-S cluster-containing protein
MELKSLKLLELKALAKSKGIHDAYKYKKDELILKLNEIEANEPSEEDKEKIKDSESLEEGAEPEQTAELPDKIVEEIESSGTEALKVTGILETHTDGYGFLRIHNYLTSDDDVYISPSQIRKRHGKDAYIVFLGPCISKKCEAYGYQLSGVMDAVISFEEIDKLMESRNINMSEFEETYPDLEGSYTGKKYPLEQGILSGISTAVENSKFTPVTISGIENLKKAFDALSNEEIDNVLIEANSCEGGCIGGPAVPKKSRNIYVRKIRARNKIQTKKDKEYLNYTPEEKKLIYIRNFRNKQYIHPEFTEEEIRRVLEQTGKHNKYDELNCGACGYDSCREKAVSVLEGLSHPQMCMPYMRNEAEKISNIYFQYSPSIILIVDTDLNILDLNPLGEKAFNTDVASVKNKPLSSIMPDKDFKHVLKTGENLEGRKLVLKKSGLTVYERIIYLKKNKILFGILNDISDEELKKEQITNFKLNTLETADRVIEKQMRVAQEIAGLLGETTAETKAALLKLKKVVLEENEQ